MNKNIIEELKQRELITQISNENKIIKKIKNKKKYIYCGFDPTKDSLHLGHLIPLITLKRFLNYGYKIIIVLGGITSTIGDPSFRKKEREINSINNINKYTQKILLQIKKFFKNYKNILLLNNKLWFSNMKVLFFLRNIGKYFNVYKILNKEAIKSRNIKNKKGITFSEISYNLLQGYDFLYLYKKYNVHIQIGGSDQWGNIISGIELIKKIYKKEVFAITLPLMTRKNGIKFGKSENNTLWLNSKKTTPYEFYQFWLNIPDDQVHKFLKQITFLSINKINKIIKRKNIYNIKKILAQEITTIIHGKKEFKNAICISNFFFKKKKIKENKKKFNKIFNLQKPKINISNQISNLKKILIKLNIVNSKSKAHNLILNKSIYINYKKILNPEYKIKKKDKLFKIFTIISKGKKNFFLIKWK